jgi:hypothetical protein
VTTVLLVASLSLAYVHHATTAGHVFRSSIRPSFGGRDLTRARCAISYSYTTTHGTLQEYSRQGAYICLYSAHHLRLSNTRVYCVQSGL